MTTKDGLNAQDVAAQKRDEAATMERSRWRELYGMYERCVEISETIWGERLDAAQEVQQGIAERMRDRGMQIPGNAPFAAHVNPHGEIPVPLFTPRDRQQFVKEVAATLLISADRRNLTVQFPKEPPTESQPEAASGADEGPGLDLEVAHLSAQTE